MAPGDIGPVEYGEHFQQTHAARGRRRHAHRVPAVGPAQRFGPGRAIRGQVLERHGPRKRRLVGGGDDITRNRTLVQRTWTVERDALQCLGVFGIAKQVALLDGVAVGPREQRAHLVGGRKGRSLAEKQREPRRHLEAQGRGTNRRLKELLPTQRTELGVRGVQHGDRARHSRGASAAHRHHKRRRLAVFVQKHVGLRARRRPLAAIDGAHLVRVRVVVQEECAAGDPGALRLDESEHRLHRNGRVDRVAPLAQNLESGIDRQRIGGSHPGRLPAVRAAMEQ